MEKLTNKILLICIALIMVSCVTQRRCYEKFPPSISFEIKTMKRDSIIYRDTTLFVTLPGERSIDSIPVPCPVIPGYKPDTAFAETSLAWAKAWLSRSRIKLQLEQKDTTITVRLDNAIKEAYYWKSEYEKIKEVPPPQKYIPSAYKTAFWAWIIIIALALGLLALKIFKPKFLNFLK